MSDYRTVARPWPFYSSRPSLSACRAAMRDQLAHYGLERHEAIWSWAQCAGPISPLPAIIAMKSKGKDKNKGGGGKRC